MSNPSFSSLKIDWSPFTICAPGEKAPYPRALTTPEGLGDRLRFVAFAEKQAVHAFASAAMIYETAPQAVRELWLTLSREEEKHLQLLLSRMDELGVSPAERPQSLALWQSFDRCKDAREFADFMANAEDRGRQGGEKFHQTLLKIDPVSANIFGRIANEEVEHIRLATEVLKNLSPDYGIT
jgi:uncharacterized ferritin-like protein (DUF455 family)